METNPYQMTPAEIQILVKQTRQAFRNTLISSGLSYREMAKITGIDVKILHKIIKKNGYVKFETLLDAYKRLCNKGK